MTPETVLDRVDQQRPGDLPAPVPNGEKEPEPGKNGQKKRRAHRNRRKAVNIVLPVLAVLSVIAAARLLVSSTTSGAKAAAEAFGQTKAEEEERIYQEYYDSSYAAAEAEYHVSNRGEIYIDSVKEKANLEVLQVSAVEHSLIDEDGTISWLEATGTGVFTVDLAAGEYLIDNERSYVLARVPQPAFTNATISNEERLLFEDGTLKILGVELLNGNTKEGEELAQRQREEVYVALKEDIASNQRFFQSAQTSARNVIVNLIRELNRDIPGLTVEVEFI